MLPQGGGIEVVMTVQKKQIRPYPLGTHPEHDSIRFSFVSKSPSCGVILYDRKTGKKIKKLPFLAEEKIGDVYCKYVQGVDASAISYQFYKEDEMIPDAYARGFVGLHSYGKEPLEKELRGIIPCDTFDWQQDANPQIPYEECICYGMHVRGFTRHSSSQVTHRGTFLGIVEKIPYLKQTGITTIELQPAYEFLEIPSKQDMKKEFSYMVSEEYVAEYSHKKLNYWGYKEGYYYAPKASYAAGEDAVSEFKTLVRELHKQGIELVMQFYFPKDVKRGEILEILRFWVLEYHVDGFRLMGEQLPVTMFAQDPVLVHTKLWYDYFDVDGIYDRNEFPTYPNLAVYTDEYCYTMRKYLKSDGDMLNAVLHQMRHIPGKTGRINYMSNYNTFTLMDMVSYDRKYNEANGEDNRDGTDYNCSWNCGEDGPSRKKKIVKLRRKQLKNAMSMLMLSQGTPFIFMGDEFGNTQYGNNNPYCQDNKTTWLDWKELERNNELYQFWCMLVALRKAHPVLHPEKELRIMDYIACGYPDLSYHGPTAWRPQLENYSRHVGIMYCGKYARKDREKEDDFFYVAMNMHWEAHELALPRLPKGMKWEPVYCTGEEIPQKKSEDSVRWIAGRSIVVFKSKAVDLENE